MTHRPQLPGPEPAARGAGQASIPLSPPSQELGPALTQLTGPPPHGRAGRSERQPGALCPPRCRGRSCCPTAGSRPTCLLGTAGPCRPEVWGPGVRGRPLLDASHARGPHWPCIGLERRSPLDSQVSGRLQTRPAPGEVSLAPVFSACTATGPTAPEAGEPAFPGTLRQHKLRGAGQSPSCGDQRSVLCPREFRELAWGRRTAPPSISLCISLVTKEPAHRPIGQRLWGAS